MSAFPTPYTVDVLPFVAGAEDSHGNATDTWGAAVTQAVHGWSGPSDEPGERGRDAVTWDLKLYAPPGFVVGPRDRVIVLGKTYEVEGDVEDFTHGPFRFAAGLRVSLRRVEG